VKFPQRAAQMLGFTPEQIAAGLLVNEIGNTYAGSCMIGLTAILDEAKPGDRILMVSFGSGAGSDAFSITVTGQIASRQKLATKTRDYVARRVQIDYATYARYRKKLLMQ
jgi:hydroxymethylglutaryl-CoA synthase